MESKASTIIPIPTLLEEITPEWVAQVTGHSVTSEDFIVDGESLAGIGFMSSICRVSYKTSTGDTHKIVVKLLPTDPAWLEFAFTNFGCADEREIKFYSVILPDLLEVVPELEENVCKFYNGGVRQADESKGTTRASMLIVEDLKETGFEMMAFSGDHSDRNVHGMITFLARFHFGSLAVEANKGASLPELYPFIHGATKSADWNARFGKSCNDGYPHLEKLLKSQNLPSEIWERYAKLKPFTNIIIEKFDDIGRRNACLIHGDIWPNNIQVNPDGLPVKVLDWQLVGYRDPTFDLAAMLYTVLPLEKVTTENVRKLVKRYHDEFEQLCEEKGYGDKIKRRSWEEFEQFFFTWGITFVFIMCLPFVECLANDFGKFANIFRVLCEENNLPEFILSECS